MQPPRRRGHRDRRREYKKLIFLSASVSAFSVSRRLHFVTIPTMSSVALNFATDWKYAPAPESASHIKLNSRYDLFINGKFTPPARGDYFDTINPATEKKLAQVASATGDDVDKAVKSARTAYEKTWRKLHAKERGKYIYRIARIIQERARELAVIESMDGGKPIRE